MPGLHFPPPFVPSIEEEVADTQYIDPASEERTHGWELRIGIASIYAVHEEVCPGQATLLVPHVIIAPVGGLYIRQEEDVYDHNDWLEPANVFFVPQVVSLCFGGRLQHGSLFDYLVELH